MSGEMRIKSQKKLNSVRRFIDGKMKDSLREIPQLTAYFELETDKLLKLKDELKAQEKTVTMTSLIVRIMASVLQEYPLFNAHVVDGQLIQYDSCNIAVGVGLERGIMTVVIKEAQDKDIFTISKEMKEKIGLLKEGQLPLEDMKDSTFTISSIGVQGIRYSTVVINPPEVAMLAVGVTEKRVVVLDDDSTVIRRITGFGITHSHTVLDGYHVGHLKDLMRQRFEDPRAYMGL